ncbi:preprotein translocase subunit SecG [Litorivivens sp.]|uniref:preprotein translocase subunit SecG n=1 Tax=Litorivivens sp. TaxID=2020868 RepID=UPI0035665E75
MEQLILIFHVLAAIAIIGLILIQQGKGADMGASFGSGASQTLFGSSGSGNALTRATAILATLFFCTSLGLAFVAKEKAGGSDLGFDEQIPALEESRDVAPVPESVNDEIPELPRSSGSEEIPQ